MTAAGSYLSGPSHTPLIGQTIGGYFDGVCAAYPGQLALVVRHQKFGGAMLTSSSVSTRWRRLWSRPA